MSSHNKLADMSSHDGSTPSTVIIRPQIFTWETERFTAPGGNLDILIGSGPSSIWQMFQSVNFGLPSSVYRKIRSCLTQIYIAYLDEAKQRSLIPQDRAQRLKQKWKGSPDWQFIEISISKIERVSVQTLSSSFGRLDRPSSQDRNLPGNAAVSNHTLVQSHQTLYPRPKVNLPCLFLTPASPRLRESLPAPVAPEVRSRVSSDLHLPNTESAMDDRHGHLPQPQVKLPGSDPSDTENHLSKKRKLEDDNNEMPSTLTPAASPSLASTPLSNLTPEQSSKLWLDYNLRSVLEANPPTVPTDPKILGAVDSARPYLLSLKTRLDCLLMTAQDEFIYEQLQVASRDLETAWGCLSVANTESP